MRAPETGRCKGMTLIELLGCVVLLAVGAATGSAGAVRFGLTGALVGFAVGVVGTWIIVVLLVGVGEKLWFMGPLHPPCRNGTCRWREWGDGGDYEIAMPDGDPVLRCRCGRDYKKVGRRFMERLPDGTLQPYMMHRPFRGWFPDTGTEE